MAKPIPRRFHAELLRRGRVSIPCQIYLVTAVTHGRRPLFADYLLGGVVVRALRFQVEMGLVESLAFVVMPDHLHWLFSLKTDAGLSDVMKSVKGYSAREIAARIRIAGAAPSIVRAVWQKGFHDHALRKDEDLKKVARYLVLNPVRGGIVADIWRYPLWDAIWVGQS